jgi:DNA-binding transcriptional MerR regulator
LSIPKSAIVYLGFLARRSDLVDYETSDRLTRLARQNAELEKRIAQLESDASDRQQSAVEDHAPLPAGEWVSLMEAASRSGLSTSWVRKWRDKGEIAEHVAGGRCYVSYDDVERALVRLSARGKTGKLIRMKTTDPLSKQRARVTAAETALETARAAMRAQAKLAGVPHASLFGESKFVLRTNAERWAADARAEVWSEVRESRKENIAALERIADDRAADRAAGIPSPFAHLAGPDFGEWQQYETDPSLCSPEYLQMRKQIDTAMALSELCKKSGVDFATAFPKGSLASPAQVTMAERIVAGAKRNGAVVELAERRKK